MANFIDEDKIEAILASAAKANSSEADEAVEKALERAAGLKGLGLEDAAALLHAKDELQLQKMFSLARKAKETIYGTRLVLFAPLYLSNLCTNNCLYCGFRRDNRQLKRRRLSVEEIARETDALLDQGHKRLLLLTGEHPFSSIEYLEEAINTVYSVRKKGRNYLGAEDRRKEVACAPEGQDAQKGGEDGMVRIRRVNVNVAPLDLDGFKRLKACGIGTYQLFQETYHRKTYAAMHPVGSKSDYEKHLHAMDLAFKGGINDLGIGALFGLYDHKFETLALLAHASHMEETLGVGPHTISVPRLEPAQNAPAANSPPHPVSDEEFKKLVAVLRLAVPYTGMILTTRETAAFRNEVFALGISQISGGSRTNPGAYAENKQSSEDESQFALQDGRTLAELVKDVCELGYLPSFCTTCYRSGRTGDYFMQFAKTGQIHNFCHPNAIMTFKEYLEDYAGTELKAIGEKAILRELENIPDAAKRELTKKRLLEIGKGKRDIYY